MDCSRKALIRSEGVFVGVECTLLEERVYTSVLFFSYILLDSQGTQGGMVNANVTQEPDVVIIRMPIASEALTNIGKQAKVVAVGCRSGETSHYGAPFLDDFWVDGALHLAELDSTLASLALLLHVKDKIGLGPAAPGRHLE
ncbi:hypothetical protein PspLS_11243 [Pyricularia sp. CBS 133598]|nr:hypothetical protein PspLS_11243 [Pyricularia sp. CBS 133598]